MSGSRGSGGTSGRGSGGGGSDLASIVNKSGGVYASDYLRSGMRDLTQARAAYVGKSAAQANRIASALKYPVRIHIEPGVNGKHRVILHDGRHRMTAAREAGATRIRATVVQYGPRGGKLRTWTGIVKL